MRYIRRCHPELGNKVAQSYGVDVKLFLTGFKYIGDQVEKDLHDQSAHFEFGYEESYGLLIAPFVRDKDALQAMVLYSEMANHYKHMGMRLDKAYDHLMKKHGYFYDISYSIMFPGAEGAKNMEAMLTTLRSNPLTTLDEHLVVKHEDYLHQYGEDKKGKYTLHTDKSDVLKYFLDNESTISIRSDGMNQNVSSIIVLGVKRVARCPDVANHLHHEILKSLVTSNDFFKAQLSVMMLSSSVMSVA